MNDQVIEPEGTAPAESMSESELVSRLTSFREFRERLERSILPLATSVDGTTFGFQAPLHDLRLRPGSYVALQSGDVVRLGQVTELVAAHETADLSGVPETSLSEMRLRLAQGSGVVLDGDGQAFHDAAVLDASPEDVHAWFSASQAHRAGVTIGELVLAPGVPAVLHSGGLGRHTFMCGQSGSGKTYSLGLLLERVLAETALRVVILDPNSDYVGLGQVRDDADPALATEYAAATAGNVAVWSNRPDADRPLRLGFADLSPAVQGAVLGLDPVRDRDEYAALVDLLRDRREGESLVSGMDDLLGAQDPALAQLGRRAANLGVLGWSVWSATGPSIVDEMRHPTTSCTVVDLGSLGTPAEQHLVAEAVLSTLWETRAERRPTLIVIDEAHNICPAEPMNDLTRLSSEHAVQIAAEGRKFGLYLLTSTQRPHKVHENVVSQCDNLLLMRMNSQTDIGDLGRLLSFVPAGLMAAATSFRMGQALVAGRLLPQATFVQMGRRLTVEGGADIPTTWTSRTPEG